MFIHSIDSIKSLWNTIERVGVIKFVKAFEGCMVFIYCRFDIEGHHLVHLLRTMNLLWCEDWLLEGRAEECFCLDELSLTKPRPLEVKSCGVLVCVEFELFFLYLLDYELNH